LPDIEVFQQRFYAGGATEIASTGGQKRNMEGKNTRFVLNLLAGCEGATKDIGYTKCE